MAVLTPAHRRAFEEDGYLVVEDVLDLRRDIDPVLAELEQVLDDLATRLWADGVIGSPHRGLPFSERLVWICIESGRAFSQVFDISLPQSGARHDTPIHVGPAAFRLLTSPRLLDLVEELLGPEIYSNPVQHIRMKLPARAIASGKYDGLVSKVSWHQDNGVILPEADAATILTVWLPLTPATVENGCLQVIPGSHRSGLESHCPSDRGVAIPDRLIATDRARPLPMTPGSVLLMTQRTVHSSLDNVTESEVRISADLRYQPTGQPTGRPAFPGFVARSAARPHSVLTEPGAWAGRWHEARARLADGPDPVYNRWSADSPVCA
jgi:ectoine hydroxylase-related dioxygenase (phytanoyl-CoA dioxygenase family)